MFKTFGAWGFWEVAQGGVWALQSPGLQGGPRCLLHLKSRQLSAFALTLHNMPGTSAKTSDEAVEQQCQKLIQEGAFHQALELLMETYGSSVYAFCYELLRDSNSAADVLQMTFVHAFRGLPGFERKFSFLLWLFAIAKHRSVDHLRTERRMEKISAKVAGTMDKEEEEDLSPLADQLIHKQQMLRAMEQCLEELRLQTQDTLSLNALIMRFRQNMAYEQISKILGSSAGALRVRVVRILPKLKQCMKSKGG